MKTVTVKGLEIGEGAPKIIVSLMGKEVSSIHSEAQYYQAFDFDILEWRIDHFDDVNNMAAILDAAHQLRSIIHDKPILFTFRTAKEGGEKEISTEDYLTLNKTLIDSGQVDMIDLELFTGDQAVSGMIEHAHRKGVKVIMSNHDFHKTPPKDEIVKRLRKMQELGADIPKIALMPQNKSDVLTLLAATLEMHEKYADRPIITMSMSKLGIISRLSGEVFGSAATFGALKKASAPGQIDIKDLRSALTIIHQS
ncbi:type I 3-dehydroquinate dehydratase [Yersinia frederiksenii]|uniref:type I 3-dehydroquinate dehydratase n=1 Tax=Yersinia frederiksenii TaxID=29484 RepID=UPI0005E8B98C|nr:type I 3-dehydroquinate dehydratase [Yersinia frederiksenii]CFR26219.1 3-dehydroquinate dehydratase [Yersinia frederiksenii]